MGDRSQVCIKEGVSKVYLYAHWSGTEIYHATARAIKRVPSRHQDSEYLARAIFCEMVSKSDWKEETGFGIGTMEHEDIEHALPTLDCDTGTVTFSNPEWRHNQSATLPIKMTFDEFADAALAGKFDEF